MRTVPRSGFTLIELMIVVSIIGLLVAVLVGVLLSASDKGDAAIANEFCNNLASKAMSDWRSDTGKSANSFPRCTKPIREGMYFDGNVDLYKAFVTDRKDANKDPYIPDTAYTLGDHGGDPVFLDPWNNPYIYRNYTMKKSLKSKSKIKFPASAQKNVGLYDLLTLGPDGELGGDDMWNGGRD
ncbi:prepilin-type N-terminal cleavage/methylation domain-containing protein [Planctomycetota bacterium]|nr:prepilin-type N-terminal cleavage/methylation domain-containing protein [Planctomycetota bacterium]